MNLGVVSQVELSEAGERMVHNILQPDVALPAQVYHLWHSTRAIAPERALMHAVFLQAMLDLQTHRYARRLRHQKIYADAYRWLMSDKRSWPFAFRNLCDTLGLCAESTRERLLKLGEVVEAPAPLHWRRAA
jgi:hypothetical protein